MFVSIILFFLLGKSKCVITIFILPAGKTCMVLLDYAKVVP